MRKIIFFVQCILEQAHGHIKSLTMRPLRLKNLLPSLGTVPLIFMESAMNNNNHWYSAFFVVNASLKT
jgi:hypothetical protein